MNEFVIEWIKGGKYAGVTAPTGSAVKTKLYKLAQEYPDDVKIMAENEDGSVFAHIPVRYVKINPPRKMSEEQKEAAGERFRQMWKDMKHE